ncbi:MAG: hypothetical protein M1833_003335 [Piccolia ochrophora]|nr:MAG: hypothetical protein M1833_003335 [Piccolia ochrophora]
MSTPTKSDTTNASTPSKSNAVKRKAKLQDDSNRDDDESSPTPAEPTDGVKKNLPSKKKAKVEIVSDEETVFADPKVKEDTQ